ncbi:phosphopyruvate hydratase [Streptomyces sp. NPDC046976]|uniref:phosphopyruvate hydratase n=1 Tax=Streptomyces sp. NPDC046976 TaxID=3155258 RepID=UPI0033E60C18
MPFRITVLRADEILDSRGRPTLSVTAGLAGGAVGHAGVPSGTSLGRHEAVELRDHDPARFLGQGVSLAVSHVNGEIADALHGRDFTDQASFDRALTDLDGTPDLSRLGANALIGVSMAVARAAAARWGRPLWEYLVPEGVTPVLPVPHLTVVDGGLHAANPLDVQSFMIAPFGARNMTEAVRAGAEIHGRLGRRLAGAEGSRGVARLGDEGGFAPALSEPEEILRLLVRTIREAGYQPGREGVAIALDVAADAIRGPDGRYLVNGEKLTSEDLIARYRQITADFPVHSIEDPLAEDDRTGWAQLTRELGGQVRLVGDDLFATNPALIGRAVDEGIANAAVIKPNQVGTVTEALRALAVCRHAGYDAMVAHRSGETEDTFIADLAVGSGCGLFKAGAPARGERVAKYNRLTRIASRHSELDYGPDR